MKYAPTYTQQKENPMLNKNNKKASVLFWIVLVLCVATFANCTKDKVQAEIPEIEENNESTEIMPRQNSSGDKLHTITSFFFDEIMNGNAHLGFHRDEYKVVELFGDPLEIIVTPVSFYFQGGTVTEFHEYVYADCTHYYYIFEDGTIFYVGFAIKRELERLKMINIDDTVDTLLSTFSDRYRRDENTGNIRYYIDSADWEILFVIKDATIQSIHANLLFG